MKTSQSHTLINIQSNTIQTLIFTFQTQVFVRNLVFVRWLSYFRDGVLRCPILAHHWGLLVARITNIKKSIELTLKMIKVSTGNKYLRACETNFCCINLPQFLHASILNFPFHNNQHVMDLLSPDIVFRSMPCLPPLVVASETRAL